MKLKVTPSVLEEWVAAEIASWEDAKKPKEGHAFNILTRHKTLIEIRTLKEAALLIKSAHYIGDTTGIDPSLESKRRAIGRIEDKLIEAYGIYYSYPHFKSKTGEVIPDPTENEPQEAVEMDRKRMEESYSLEHIKQMARDRGLPTIGTKREIIARIIHS